MQHQAYNLLNRAAGKYDPLSDGLKALALLIFDHAIHVGIDGFYDGLELSNLFVSCVHVADR